MPIPEQDAAHPPVGAFEPPRRSSRRSGAPPLPDVIGRYRIVGLLGEGGMGTVYEAEQSMPQRRVALKMMRTGLAAADMRWRFERESEALGRLQHPGIAQIYEAGTWDGPRGPQPYFAMELVRGHSLVEHARTLDDERRVALVAAICDAVHYAHQRGVIHRDLKPANVLVDDSGQPKILDFGVARLTDVDVAGTRATMAGEVIGTLQYMAPEQLAADPLAVDVRCDVYALGVMLYELLAERRPYEVTGRNFLDAMRLIVNDEPPSLGSIDRRLRGDIEVIAAKCLDKTPDRRYASAAGLANDLRRYLRDEPITARPASAVYQLRKLARRHRAIAVGAGIAALALVLGTGVSTAMALRARTAQRVAEARGAEAVSARTLAESRGREAVAAGALAERRRGEAEAGRLTADSARALARREAAAAVASARHASEETAKAEAVNAFLQDMLGSTSPDVARGRELTVRQVADEAARRVNGGSLRAQPAVEARVRMTLGTTYRQVGVADSARVQFDRARALFAAASGPRSLDVADALHSLGDVLIITNDYPGAERAFDEALAIQRGRRPADTDRVVELLIDLATVRYTQGRMREAEALRREALATARARYPGPHRTVADAMLQLATMLTFTERAVEAEPMWREAIAMQESFDAPDDPDLAQVRLNWAYTLLQLRKLDEAEAEARKSIAVFDKVYGDEPRQQANAYARLGAILAAAGKTAEAEPIMRRTLALRLGVHGEGHADVLYSQVELGRLLVGLGKRAEAESLYTIALAGRRALFGPRHPAVASSLDDIASLVTVRGEHATAERMYVEALRIWREASLGRAEMATGGRAARAMMAQGHFAAADSLLREMIGRAAPNEASTPLAMALEALADARLGLGTPDGARSADSLLVRTVAVRRAMTPSNGVATTQRRLAEIRLQRGDTAAAIAALTDAEATLRALTRPDAAQQRAAVIDQLAGLLKATGQTSEADAWRARKVARP